MTLPAHVISLMVGLLSLGAETLWVRLYAFANQSVPKSMAIVLGIYLLGIAKGAAIGGGLCRTSSRLREIMLGCILAASAVIALSPLLAAVLPRNNVVLLPLIYLPAFLLSICFPICHHLGTQLGTQRVGRSLSRVYAANIAGSVIGPLLTNFVILQYATTQMAFVILGLLGVTMAAIMAISENAEPRLKGATAAAAVVTLGLLGAVSISQSQAGSMQNLLVAKLAVSTDPIRHVVETRQGIIVSHVDDAQGDSIFGANVYDGRTNVDPRINSNGINRIIVLHALAPNPKRVLVIGLSVGSWQHIIGGFPGVERMDVVEINPGYIDLAKNYDVQRKAIEDPRVNLIIGDGRKFLRQNPDLQYDVVVMNTTWHWRVYASLLLSREFLGMVYKHMAPDAVMTFNTTHSIDALKTAKAVFPHAYLYDNFVIAARFDWRQTMASAEAKAQLKRIRPAGKPLFGPNDDDIVTDFLGDHRILDLPAAEAKAGRAAEVITDRNLITEYRYGR